MQIDRQKDICMYRYPMTLSAQKFDTELTLGNYINKYFYRKNIQMDRKIDRKIYNTYQIFI